MNEEPKTLMQEPGCLTAEEAIVARERLMKEREMQDRPYAEVLALVELSTKAMGPVYEQIWSERFDQANAVVKALTAKNANLEGNVALFTTAIRLLLSMVDKGDVTNLVNQSLKAGTYTPIERVALAYLKQRLTKDEVTG